MLSQEIDQQSLRYMRYPIGGFGYKDDTKQGKKDNSNLKATVNVGIQERNDKTYSEMKGEDRMKKIRTNTISGKQIK